MLFIVTMFYCMTYRDSNELANLKTEVLRTGEAKIYEDSGGSDEELMSTLSKDLNAQFLTVSQILCALYQYFSCCFNGRWGEFMTDRHTSSDMVVRYAKGS